MKEPGNNTYKLKTKEKQPAISVVILVYNNMEQYLGESIESILDQAFTIFEFIIINNDSTDYSWKIVQPYLDSWKATFRNKTNLENYLSRNRGLKIANREIYCSCGYG
jgi:glycosyltransferase involved in cell wall biosynthesis